MCESVTTINIFRHVLNRGGRGVRSPDDGLARRGDERLVRKCRRQRVVIGATRFYAAPVEIGDRRVRLLQSTKEVSHSNDSQELRFI